MGKGSNEAASVGWSILSAAIQANPNKGASLGGGAASTSLMTMPVEETRLSWLVGWTEDTTFTVADVISFVLWVRDPMYRVAAQGIRHAMEREEAATLLEVSEKAWTEHNGKARGWVRKHLEEDLRARSSGANATPDAWESARTNKRAAQLVDYVCVMRGIRIGLWFPAGESVGVSVIPAAGGIRADAPFVQLNGVSGHVMLGPGGEFIVPATSWSTLFASATGAVWEPAMTTGSMNSNTTADIQGRLRLIDPAADMTGNRAALWNRLHWSALITALALKGDGHNRCIE
jgi:hypothetical protein